MTSTDFSVDLKDIWQKISPYSLNLHFVPYGRFYVHVCSDLMLQLIIFH